MNLISYPILSPPILSYPILSDHILSRTLSNLYHFFIEFFDLDIHWNIVLFLSSSMALITSSHSTLPRLFLFYFILFCFCFIIRIFYCYISNHLQAHKSVTSLPITSIIFCRSRRSFFTFPLSSPILLYI